MSNLQWYVYSIGFIFFIIGIFFYYQKIKADLTESQKTFRHRFMYFFLILALLCVIYSWL